ncbi:hypothetical protein WJX72_001286 [[Myrmecia] bisecta]|uniref:Cystathionine beta-lyase n=1 Tax=[Myrmecia] bisecta TaxID=41462 RepID=A0AAW1P745_9CHLO
MASFNPEESFADLKREFGEYGGVNASVEVSTTFTVLRADTMPDIFSGKLNPDNGSCFLYGRSFNPTVRYLGRQLAALEGTEAAYATSSGLAAISSTLLRICNTGDHIVSSNAVYGGSFALMKDFLPTKCGIRTTFVNVADLAAVEAAITDRTKVIFTEAVSNPTLIVADLPRLAELAHAKGIMFVVDNTFSPMIISPARWGADVVVHSMTKFLSGASDIVAGCICGSAAFIASLMDLHNGPIMLLGPTMDPKVASELSLRLPHLGIRMAEHSRRGQAYAERLTAAGTVVTYPGLSSHPQHSLMRRLHNPDYGFGGLLTVDLGSQQTAERFMERLQNRHRFGLIAVSLGYFETLMSCSGASTSSELTELERSVAGISGGLVRMSVGITGSVEQRWKQLDEAFRHVQANPSGLLPYRAAPMVRNGKGELTRMPSWASMGSSLQSDGSPHFMHGPGPFDSDTADSDTAEGRAAAGGRSGSEDIKPAHQADAADGGPPAKIRRIGAVDVAYTKVTSRK